MPSLCSPKRVLIASMNALAMRALPVRERIAPVSQLPLKPRRRGAQG